MRSDTRVTFAEREEMSRSVAAGGGVRAITRQLGRSPSTISQERHRAGLTPRSDRAAAAQQGAAAARPRRRRKLAQPGPLQEAVPPGLRQRGSPAQMAQRREVEDPAKATMRVAPETSDTSLDRLPRGALKRELRRALRRRRQARQARGGPQARRGQIAERLSIEARPAEVADRTVPGHWDGDRLVGRRGALALGTLVERTSRIPLRVPWRAREATRGRPAFAQELRTLPQQLARSLTDDQGKARAAHRLFTQERRSQVYVAPPPSPWERGTNENTHGLIRQCFPTGTDFARVSRRQIKHVQDLLNGRPRKVLNWKTPSEVFHHVPVARGT